MSELVLTISILLAAGHCLSVAGLSCYECSVPIHRDGEEQDLRCVYEPWNLTGSVKTCLPHMKACKTVRINHRESGRIKSFVRGCSPHNEDKVEETQDAIIYSRYCFTNKCNTGEGMRTTKDDLGQRIVAILVADENAAEPALAPLAPLVVTAFLSAVAVL